jgi:hypothetical protein
MTFGTSLQSKRVILQHKPLKLIRLAKVALEAASTRRSSNHTTNDKKLSSLRFKHLDLEIGTHLKQYLIVICFLQIGSYHFPLPNMGGRCGISNDGQTCRKINFSY